MAGFAWLCSAFACSPRSLTGGVDLQPKVDSPEGSSEEDSDSDSDSSNTEKESSGEDSKDEKGDAETGEDGEESSSESDGEDTKKKSDADKDSETKSESKSSSETSDESSSKTSDESSSEGDDSSAPETVKGDLKIAFRTKTFKGRYSPRNVGAVWIEDEDGKFLRTVKVWARKRAVHLIKWNRSSDGDRTDAISGATISSHKRHEMKWDRKDAKGKTHGVGDYILRVEFTEHNSASNNKGGPSLKIPFHLGGGKKQLDVSDKKNYVDIEITTPD